MLMKVLFSSHVKLVYLEFELGKFFNNKIAC